MSRALTVVRELYNAYEPKLYGKLPSARYVEGFNTSSPEVVAAFTAHFLTSAQHVITAEELHTLITRQEQVAQGHVSSHRGIPGADARSWDKQSTAPSGRN